MFNIFDVRTGERTLIRIYDGLYRKIRVGYGTATDRISYDPMSGLLVRLFIDVLLTQEDMLESSYIDLWVPVNVTQLQDIPSRSQG